MASKRGDNRPDSDDSAPTKKRKVAPVDRFKPSSDQEVIDKITKGYLLQNAQKSTKWAMRVFEEWRPSRADDTCPSDIIEAGGPDALNHWIPQFIREAQRGDGKPYRPRTIHQLLAGIQRFMLQKDHARPKFLDKGNALFRPIHGACDFVYQSSQQWNWCSCPPYSFNHCRGGR